MNKKSSLSTRGILHAVAGQEKFSLSRFDPDARLSPFVEHYWSVSYALPSGVSHTQTVLSYPNIHLAFEQDEAGRRALLYGIPERPFVRKLSGTGKVLGIKFRAGGFYPFWQQAVSALTGQTLDASRLFGSDMSVFRAKVLHAAEDATMAEQAERILLTRLPERDSQAEKAGRIVEETIHDRSIIKVEQLSERSGLSIRQLQRLFSQYIGVSPKWVIKRFRLQEAAERLEQDDSVEWAELAVHLGYFDQAHFIKDFKSVVGTSPAHYRESLSVMKET
ncbi:AraC family transcriptional regulator [Aureibacillus halotolerans]|uniref:AraC family transcriptional regulator n=2 Tax=Aureibacillus halotolerans TaxID=1508390 RepID=A0A4R6TTF9_9BACI|nr:AraC family transcriptional regulator [Aureibacillus halotolerans]